jgi:class 3 adenylate cyclase/tetratricopeptide (TPR) repeat protein
MSCGGPLGELREERKIVSVLFCDLAGSTEAAHASDPEDVRRAMQAYYSDVRDVIARFGGVVEKFIGDAVVGVWGVPQTREDDAERAVLAALNVLGSVTIDVRIAVNTGSVLAVVDPGVDPGAGVVGDVVNTAARLQAVAPIRAVVVGETTMRATERTIDYGALQPVVVKGKPDPVPVFRALAASDRPRRRSDVDTPFLGRRSELELLLSVFQRAMDVPGLQLATVVGEPGIGKSRLVAEFERTVAERARTLRGHCLAYGDGMGFWPLGEAVKQYLGIDERDSAERARTALDHAVEEMEDGAWLRLRLAPLVGLKGEGGAREEVFAAWQRFFDEIASQMPLVLVLEDLHWAHPAMLAFIQYLAEWSVDVPLVLVGTARPELLESNPGWAAGLANVTTIALRPLDDAATRELARALVRRGETDDDSAQALVDRCGGNPLYAEEFARLLSDQRLDARNADLDVPQGVHAVIAARVDTLARDRKELLHHAAVVGKVFWAGAVADLAARDPTVVRSELHELARKELIRRSRRSVLPGDEEYVFWHDLVHQVTYEQIPRSRRGETHRRVAMWIERSSDERLGDRAELIAYHYTTALSIAERDGLDIREDVRVGAVRFTTLAAERAIGMDVEHAVELLNRALRLEDGPTYERGKILCLMGTCDMLAGRFEEAIPALHEARGIADDVGDLQTLGTAYFQEAEALFFSGAGRWMKVTSDGIRRLEGEAPTGGLAALLGQAAFGASTRNDNETAMRLVDRAIDVAGHAGDQFSLALAVDIRGLIRARTGDGAAFDDFEEATRLFQDLGSPYATMSMTHLGGAIHLWHGPARAAQALAQAIAHGSRIRNATYEADARIFDINRLFDQGRWDDLIAAADHLTAWTAGKGSDSEAAAIGELKKTHVLTIRGEPPREVAERSAAFADGNERDDGGYALTVCALVAWAAGDHARALTFVQSLAPAHITSTSSFAEISRLAATLGVPHHARTLLATVHSGPPAFHHNVETANAIFAECDGDMDRAALLYSEAAAAWRAFGAPYELAHSLSGQARCTSNAERDALQAESDEIFDSLGASYKARTLGAATAP